MSNWQTKKLGDIMDFIPTGAHSRNDMKTATGSEEEVLNIHYGDIHTKYSTYVDCEEDSVPALKDNNIRAQMLLKDGDLVVADASEDYDGVGSSVELRNVSDRKVIGGLHTFALRSKDEEFASGFTGLMLKNPATRKRLMQMSVYSKVYGLTKSSISSVDVSYPEKPEQERIVGVLEVWDEYIEKLEQKIALKEQLKKGLMQQLLTGKRRLPGFSEEWRTYKLGDFLQEPIYKRETNPKDIELLTVRLHTKGVQASGKFPFATEKGRPYYRRYQGEILVGRQNFHNGGVGEVTEETNGLIASNAISSYLPKVNADLDFILFALQRGDFYKRIGHIIGGTGQKEISPSEFKKLKITMPELEEQKAIASVIKKSNEDLHTLYEYAKYINQQKKYLLKNLITGTIRTPEDLQPLDTSRLERSAL